MTNQTCILCGYDGEAFIMYHSDIDGQDYPLCGDCQYQAAPALIQRRIQNLQFEQRRRGINF